MDTVEPLSTAVDAFLAATNMAAVRFGRDAMNDPHFVRDLRAGRRVWPETETRVRDFMATYRPAEQAAAA